MSNPNLESYPPAASPPAATSRTVMTADGAVPYDPAVALVRIEIERDKAKYAFWGNIITPVTGAVVIMCQVLLYILTHQAIDTKTGEIKAEAKAANAEVKAETQEVKKDLAVSTKERADQLHEIKGVVDKTHEEVKTAVERMPPTAPSQNERNT